MVPSSWRHAAVHVGPHIRKVSVIRRTRRYRSSARSRGWSSGDSSPSGAKLIYHFTRTGPQRCDSQRRPRISGVGRAVEIRTCGQETQASQTAYQFSSAQACPGSLGGKLCDAQARAVAGPRQVPFIGRNKPHRGYRKGVDGWFPEAWAHVSE